METDYLAVIFIGAGSCWGRDKNRDTAVKAAIRVYRSDVGSIYKIRKGDKIVVNVLDVAPHDEVRWTDHGFFVGDDKLDRKIEHVRHTF
jgi:hypothetical protein